MKGGQRYPLDSDFFNSPKNALKTIKLKSTDIELIISKTKDEPKNTEL